MGDTRGCRSPIADFDINDIKLSDLEKVPLLVRGFEEASIHTALDMLIEALHQDNKIALNLTISEEIKSTLDISAGDIIIIGPAYEESITYPDDDGYIRFMLMSKRVTDKMYVLAIDKAKIST